MYSKPEVVYEFYLHFVSTSVSFVVVAVAAVALSLMQLVVQWWLPMCMYHPASGRVDCINCVTRVFASTLFITFEYNTQVVLVN